mmetsp:Transcript_100391/g.287268  ORF Transcript_100391/g.287268 Transcript_100391/m.287268 type:complete len:1299 (-) Transcript_100391:536-4432(-)
MASQHLVSGHVSLKEKRKVRRDVWQDAYMKFETATKTLRLYSLTEGGEVDKEVYSTSVLGVQVPHPKLGIAKRPNRFDVIVPESQGGLLCFSTPSQDLRTQFIGALHEAEDLDDGENDSENESNGSDEDRDWGRDEDGDHDHDYGDRYDEDGESYNGYKNGSPDGSHNGSHSNKSSSNADTDATDNMDAATTPTRSLTPTVAKAPKSRSATPKKPRPPPPPMPATGHGSSGPSNGRVVSREYARVPGNEPEETKADRPFDGSSHGSNHNASPHESPLKMGASEEARRHLAASTAQLTMLAEASNATTSSEGGGAFFDSAFDTDATGTTELTSMNGGHDTVLPLLQQGGGGEEGKSGAEGNGLKSLKDRLEKKGSIKDQLVAAAAKDKAASEEFAASSLGQPSSATELAAAQGLGNRVSPAKQSRGFGWGGMGGKKKKKTPEDSDASKAWGLAYSSLMVGKTVRAKKNQGEKKKKKQVEEGVKLSQSSKKMRKGALELIKAIETKPKSGALKAVMKAVEEEGLRVDVDVHEAEKELPLARRTPETKRTPLIAAVRSGNVNVVKFLLEHGADKQLDCYSTWGPLHYAAESYDLATFELLYEVYANAALTKFDPDTGEDITTRQWLQRHRTRAASDMEDTTPTADAKGSLESPTTPSTPHILSGSSSFSVGSSRGLTEMGGGGAEAMTVLDVALSSRRWRMVSTPEQAAKFIRHILKVHELPVNPERCMTLVARGGCLMVLKVVISELQLEPWTCDPSLWLAPIFEFGFVPMLDFLLTNTKLKGTGSGGGGPKAQKLEALFGDRVFANAISNAQTDPLAYFIGDDLVNVTPRYRKWGRKKEKGPYAGDFADVYHNRVFEWLVAGGSHGRLFKLMLREESMDGIIHSIFDSCRSQAFLMQTGRTLRVYWSKKKLRVLCGYTVVDGMYEKLVPVRKQAVALFIHSLDKRPELKPLIQHDFFTVAIEMKMRAFGRRVMAFELVMYALLLMFFSLGFVAYPDREYIGFRIACWILSLYQWLKEILELRSGGLVAYVSDPWNYLNMSLLLGLLSLAFLEDEEASDPRHASLSALVSLSIWTGVLQFVNLNESAAAFVITIQRMMMDMCKFLVMFLIFWMGFSYAFYLMLGVNGPLGDEYVEGFGSVKDSLATTFLIMLGDWDYDAFTDNNFVQIGFFVYVLLSVVLLLNMLIAMMSSSFEEVRENASVEARIAMWESVIRLETYVDMCGGSLWGQCYARMEDWLCEKAETLKVSKVEREYLKEDVLKETRLTRQEPVPPTPPRDYAAECHKLMETLRVEFKGLGEK